MDYIYEDADNTSCLTCTYGIYHATDSVYNGVDEVCITCVNFDKWEPDTE